MASNISDHNKQATVESASGKVADLKYIVIAQPDGCDVHLSQPLCHDAPESICQCLRRLGSQAFAVCADAPDLTCIQSQGPDPRNAKIWCIHHHS